MSAARTVILAEGAFDNDSSGKTAYGILRYAPESVVAVIDSRYAGLDSYEVSGLGRGIPVVSDLTSALKFNPRRLVVGVAPAGGGLPDEWRKDLAFALRNGMEVVSGLHTILSEDKEFVDAALSGGGKIFDLRKVPDDIEVALCRAQEVSAAVVLTVGTDCCAGKMTTSLELAREAEARGIKSRFAPTGQTGIAIEGWGISVDHAVSDFTPGAAERLVLEAGADSDVELISVEGQGALAQPVYSGVTLAIMHGCLPDALILCHRANQRLVELVDLPMPPLRDHIIQYEEMMRLVKPAKVKAVSLNTRELDESEARRAIDEAMRETGLPATDPVRFGARELLDGILEGGLDKMPLYSGPEGFKLDPGSVKSRIPKS